jgi:hypothetical protein
MDRVANNQIQAQKLDEFRDQWWESLSTGLKAGNVLTEIESLVTQISGGGGGKSSGEGGVGGGKGGNGKSILKIISSMSNGGFDKAKKDEEDKIKEKEKKEKEAQAKAKSKS